MTEQVKIKELGTAHIKIDGGTQNRVEINETIVAEYAEAIKSGAAMPPVVVFYDGSQNWLADGFHRWHAANQAGTKRLMCEVRHGMKRDAVLFSLGVNGTHGLRRSNADKRKAVETALKDAEWGAMSDNWIAEHCAVSNVLVATVRKESNINIYIAPDDKQVRKTKDGRAIPIKNMGRPVENKPAETPPDDANDSDPYDDVGAAKTDGYGRPIPKELEEVFEEMDEIDESLNRAEIVYDNSADFKKESEMTDDEWLESLPIYRVLKTKQHKAIFMREDLLSIRKLWPQIEKFQYHAVRAFDQKALRNTPAAQSVRSVQTLPHPADWQICGPCRGNGCTKCDHAGYHIHGAGISPLRVEKGEVQL